MNQRRAIDNQPDWVSAHDAVLILGVKKATLYAYASRGTVRSSPGRGGSRERMYSREDLERIRARSLARSGHTAVAAGALRWGEPVLETSVGTIDARGPIYQGRPVVELLSESFEDVCALLWKAPFVLPKQRSFGVAHAPLRSLLRPTAEPFDAIMLAATALASHEQRGEGIELVREKAGLLVRRLVASFALPKGGEAIASSLDADSTSRALLLALGGRTTEPNIAAMNKALILCAEHELNASTFAARVASSTGATLGSSLVAALATLSGPLHGGLAARVDALVTEIDRPERAADIIAARLDRGEAIPGFGHPLYPAGDPRGRLLLEVAQSLSSKSKGVRVLTAVTSAMHLVAREKPTLDVGLVALASALNLPKGAPLAIFASGRLAGWIAHALEQRQSGHLLRPRARYVE